MTLSHDDVRAYMNRIRYSGAWDVSLRTLNDLILHHTLCFPFENLDVHLGNRIRLDPPAVMKKLVHGGRGGYCYESNGLFMYILRFMGYTCVILSSTRHHLTYSK